MRGHFLGFLDVGEVGGDIVAGVEGTKGFEDNLGDGGSVFGDEEAGVVGHAGDVNTGVCTGSDDPSTAGKLAAANPDGLACVYRFRGQAYDTELRSKVSLYPQTDVELVMAVAHGDVRALEELYVRYSHPVFSMAYSLLRDYAAAEDVAQEVFVALWTRAGRFDPERGIFRHWFLHMAHNRVIDELRKRKRVSMHSAYKTPEDPELRLQSAGNTADQAITAVMFGAAADALKLLPEEQRVAVVMAYLEGATQQEIATRTGVPLGTVKTRLRLGLIKLRNQLAQPASEEA